MSSEDKRVAAPQESALHTEVMANEYLLVASEPIGMNSATPSILQMGRGPGGPMVSLGW